MASPRIAVAVGYAGTSLLGLWVEGMRETSRADGACSREQTTAEPRGDVDRMVSTSVARDLDCTAVRHLRDR